MPSASAQRARRTIGVIAAMTLLAGDSGKAQTAHGAQGALRPQSAGKAGTVSVEKVTCVSLPNCYKLANGQVELIVTTDIGPRVMRYAFVGGENILGELPGSVAEKDKQTRQGAGSPCATR